MQEKKRENKSGKSDKNFTKQVRIDCALHRLLKIKAAQEKTTVKALLEQGIAEVLEII